MQKISNISLEPIKTIGDDWVISGDVIEPLFEKKSILQRSEEWHLKRNGRFTGSKISLLMSCGRSGAKLPWGDSSKLFSFGDTAIKYIYNKAMERKTGIAPKTASSYQMRWGQDAEPYIIDTMLMRGDIFEHIEKGFELFPGLDCAGSSPDGAVVCMDSELRGFELKACVSWDGYYERMYEPIHVKHKDFWQVQSEMISLGLDELLYVVAMPMEIEKYEMQVVKASPVHQHAIKERCKISDLAINKWLDGTENISIKHALEVACAEYKEIQENE